MCEIIETFEPKSKYRIKGYFRYSGDYEKKESPPKHTTTITLISDELDLDVISDSRRTTVCPQMESSDALIRGNDNKLIVYSNERKYRKRLELNYNYRIIQKKYSKIRSYLTKIFNNKLKYQVCQFNQFQMNLHGICGYNNLSKFIERVSMSKYERMFICIWKTCYFETKFLKIIFKHIHDQHICPKIHYRYYF